MRAKISYGWPVDPIVIADPTTNCNGRVALPPFLRRPDLTTDL
jgi:hypothetical protein